LSQELTIKQLKEDKRKILVSDNIDPHQKVLMEQILDMKIQEKKREVKKKLSLVPP
jgi:hypothetical protein